MTKALLSAHTPEGGAFRDKTLDSVGEQAKAIKVKDTTLEHIAETTSEDVTRELALAARSNNAHSVMTMQRPKQQLVQMLDKHRSLVEQTQEILETSFNNKEADFDSREKFANSLLAAVQATSMVLINDNGQDGMKMFSVMQERAQAELLIKDYRIARISRKATIAETKLGKLTK